MKDKETSSGHRTLLSKDHSVYEMLTDTVIPEEWDNYLQHKEKPIGYFSSLRGADGQLSRLSTYISISSLKAVSRCPLWYLF